jgi:NAD-dependent SIR2 family protein deacetylase
MDINDEPKPKPEDDDEVPDDDSTANTVPDKDTQTKPKGGDAKPQDEPDLNYDAFIQNFKDEKYTKILVLTGAGMSVSAGIPDFRSPKIGLYAVLKEKYDMESPEEIFSIHAFNKKPEIFYDFAKGFDWDKYNPTPTHYFLRLLEKKGILFKNLTQNIDCLELKAGMAEEMVIPCHGDLRGAECAKCRETHPVDVYKEHV